MKKIKILLPIIILLSLNMFGQEIKEKSEESIKATLGSNVSISMDKVAIPVKLKGEIEKESRQKFFSDHVYLFKVNAAGEDYYAMLDNVLGKSMPITFIVIFNSSGEIISSDIIKYREQYGGQVGNRKWNDQFKERKAGSDFTPGKSVDNITGATISVNSVSAGIKKLTLLFDRLKDKL